MISSAILLFLSFAQADIHSFQVLGISATFGRPEAVVYALAVITLYFFYRYVVYLLQEPEFKISTEFFNQLNRYAYPKIVSLRDRTYPAGKGFEIYENLGVRKAGKFSWVIMVAAEKDQMGGFISKDLIVSLKEIWWEAVKASLLTLVARSYFTDYFFPFLLALVALTVTFLEKWLRIMKYYPFD